MANEFKVKNGLIVVGDLTTSGTITINGALAATQSWVTSQAYLTSVSLSGYATQSYVTSAISALVDAAPAALDTLNELAAALGDDANFSTTVTNSIAGKMALYNGVGAPDFNTNTTNGIYRNQGGANAPVSGSHFTMFSAFQPDGNYGWQLAASANDSLYFRFKDANFNSWVQLATRSWVTSQNYLTSYTDTLATVTSRGASTSTPVTFNGNVTLGNNADLVFQDLSGTFPTTGKGFDWTLNNDGARIYAVQPGSDSIDLVFQLRDNATTNDRFVFWVDEWQGPAYDKYPLIISGGTEFDLKDSSLYTNSVLRLSNSGVLQNVTGNISMFTNNAGYLTSESDTLATVTGRGATTSTNISVNTINIGTDATYGAAYRSVSFGYNGDGSNRILAANNTSDGMYFMAATGQGFNFRPNGGTANLVVINSTGYVGIGTTSPNYKLDVNGSINIYSGNSLRWGSGDAEIINSGYNLLFKTYTGSALTEKMRITPGGSLLLGGSVTPGETAWYGTGVFGPDGNDKIILGYLGSGTNGATIGAHNSALNSWADLNITGPSIIFRNLTQTETIRITNAGNVGIGTSSPSYKLDVSGTARFTQSISLNQSAVIKKRFDSGTNNPVKTSSGVLTSRSDNASGSTYYVIETNVPQDEYQMGGFTIELFGNYSSTNHKTKIDLGGYWNPEGNGGFIGFEAHGSNPQYKPTIEVARNTSTGNTAFIIYGLPWNYPVIVARDLWLGYSGTDGGAYGEGWSIVGTETISGYSNRDTVVWRNAYSDSNPAGYITGYTETDTLNSVTSRGASTSNAITVGATTINGVWQTNISTAGGWSKLSFTASNAWGDGTTYGVLGASGGNEPGVMVYNMHATWAGSSQGAGIRMGRSGGVSSGAWYQVATMDSNEFMIAKNGQWSNGGIKITDGGVLYYGNTGYRYIWENGTWDINISGNAATATTANSATTASSVPWSGITGKPSGSTGLVQYGDFVNYPTFAGKTVTMHPSVIKTLLWGGNGTRYTVTDSYTGTYPQSGSTWVRTYELIDGSNSVYSSGNIYCGFWNNCPPTNITVRVQNTSGTWYGPYQGSNIGVGYFEYWRIPCGGPNFIKKWEITFTPTSGCNVALMTVDIVIDNDEGIDQTPLVGRGGSSMYGNLSFVGSGNTTNLTLNTSGVIVFPNTSNAGLSNSAGDAGFRLDDIYGNIYTWNTSGGYYVDANSYYFRSTGASNWMTINSGTVQASADFRAPIFYDSQDTSYYVDPNSSSRVSRLWVDKLGGIGTYSWVNAALTTSSIEIVNQVGENGSLPPTLAFHWYGDGGPQFRLAADTSNILYLESAATGSANTATNSTTYFNSLRLICQDATGLYVNGNGVWHSGNDGSGSGLDADLLDGQNSTEFLRLLSGGAEASLDSYTDNGVRSVSFAGHSQHLLSWNAGGSTGTVQQLFHYGTPNNGWRIRNKTDNSSWSDWGYVVMASSNQGLISGTIATQSWVGSQSYATTSYVTTQINNLINGAPGALDTLDELAAALGDDSNFATTVTNSIAGKVSKSGDTMTGNLTLSGGTNILFTGGSHSISGNSTGYLHFHGYTNVYFNEQLVIRGGIQNDGGNVLIDDNLNVNGELAFLSGGGGYTNIIRSAAYPSEGYPPGSNYWIEYRAQGGHHFILNTDGGVGAGLASMDDFVIWQGAIDGNRLLEVSNIGNLWIAGALTEASSVKLKENIETSEGNLEKVVNLRPVTYNKIGSQTTELGLIAEEVAEVYPEFVQYDENGEPVGVHYSRLTAALIGAVKELTNQVQELNKKING